MTTPTFDVEALRAGFPALARRGPDPGHPARDYPAAYMFLLPVFTANFTPVG